MQNSIQDEALQDKEKKFIESITSHLKYASRRVFKVNTGEEILNYLADTFIKIVNCDFIAVATVEQGKLELNTIRGDFEALRSIFPYLVNDVNPLLIKQSLRSDEKNLAVDSPVRTLFERNDIESWFTIPIAEDNEFYGLIIAGYYETTSFYNQFAESFNELGSYAAIAIKLARNNRKDDVSNHSLEWFSQNLSFNDSLYDLVNKIISFAGKESRSQYAAIYLLNDEKDSLVYQQPSYGYLRKDKVISIDENDLLESYFSHVEEVGHSEITVPIVSNLEMVGVIFAGKGSEDFYTGHDLDLLQMYANYFSAMQENAQLLQKEKQDRRNLEKLVDIQQQFIRKTVETDGFVEINSLLGEVLNTPVILFDRFLNVIDYHIDAEHELLIEDVYKSAGEEKNKPSNYLLKSYFQLEMRDNEKIDVSPINDGNELYAFIALRPEENISKEIQSLIYNTINNIYSLQFIKRKINRNTREQIKNNFVQKLLIEKIDSLDEIMEYASDFNWDLYEPHRVSVISIAEFTVANFSNLLDKKTQTTYVLEHLKDLVSFYNKDITTAIINEELILFTPIDNGKKSADFWKELYQYVLQDEVIKNENLEIVIGIGDKTNKPEEYYESYQKALETVNILQKENEYQNYAFFDDLGSYTVLGGVKENPSTKIFIQKYLKDLYQLSNKQQIDLYETLRTYLTNNGNISKSAEDLFLHRSTLTYRLNKIKDEIEIDIDDSSEQFNLMLAFKLADLYGHEEILEDKN